MVLQHLKVRHDASLSLRMEAHHLVQSARAIKLPGQARKTCASGLAKVSMNFQLMSDTQLSKVQLSYLSGVLCFSITVSVRLNLNSSIYMVMKVKYRLSLLF